MARHTGFEVLYEAGQRFVDAALKGDDSLFTPGRSIWNAKAIEDLFHRYVEEDTSRDKLEIKLPRQIADADDVTRQLAAELLYVHLLLPCDTKADKKRGMVKTLLAPLRPEVTIPDELSQPLDPGIATIGAALARQSAQFTYLLRLVQLWKSLSLDERSRLLADPWAFKNFLYADRVPLGGAGVQREALLYLLFPDTFEDSVSGRHKLEIVSAFKDRIVEPTDDVDRQLAQIRRSLADEYGAGFSFYEQRMRPLWPVEESSKPPERLMSPGVDMVKPSDNSYDRLLTAIEKDLHFPVEVVSNYLLALQAKRFVILTGISGTGKTQMALAIAKYFQPRVRLPEVVHVPADAVELQVAAYMLRYHRTVLPVTFVADLALPTLNSATNSGQIMVQYPAGSALLTIRKDPDRNVTHLLFKGDFRAWFDAHLTIADRFLLQAVEMADGIAHALRFSLPETREREKLVDNYEVIAVRPDWTDNRGLLGYYNPLTGRYAITPFLRLLLRATEECEQAKRENRPTRPFFAILDEMNLARVEHYFSDFLSCLESGEKLDLHDDPAIERGENEDGVVIPRQLTIPENLFFTGTVNVDETTYMFSPKVLDRAFTIEFNEVDLEGFGAVSDSGGADDMVPLYLRQFAGALNDSRKPITQDWAAFGALLAGSLRRVVIDLNAVLAAEGRHFGYRVADEIARFVLLAQSQAGDDPDTLWAALDLAILEKVLPKFHGTQQELGSVLQAVFAFALDVDGGASQSTDALQYAKSVWQGRLVPANAESVDPELPRTAAKVWIMLKRLRQQGFTSFIG